MDQQHLKFDRSRLKIEPLARRNSDLGLSDILPLKGSNFAKNSFRAIASKIHESRENNSSTILMMGAHVLRSGVQRYIIDLMERGYLSSIGLV